MKWLNGYKIRLVLIGFIVSGLSSMPSVCSALEHIWQQKADMPTPRWFHSASVVDGKVYIIGGWPSEPSSIGLSDVEEYDPVTDTWIKKADMLAPRGYHSSSVVDGKIYVVGGCGFNYKELSTVEEYDPATDTWTRKADMPTSRFCLSTCAVEGKIYAIGGAVWGNPLTSTRGMSTVEVYDPVTNTWTTKTNMPTPRWGLSSSVVDGRIYAIGGSPGIHGQNKVEMYDPADDSWTLKADMPTGRRNFSTSVLYGKIYAIGGWRNSGNTCFSTAEVYDPWADSWMQIADLPAVRSCLSTSVVAGKIYAIGGTPTPHPCLATSTVYKLTAGFPPDFNGDGVVDCEDICIIVCHWHTDESSYDIGPTPWGDGIVDVQDLIVLTEYIGQKINDPTLVAHWALDETEGDIAYDSTNVYDGVLNGVPTWQPTDGAVDGALEFDGIDDYISTPFVLDPAAGPLSVFTWIKGGVPGQVIIAQQPGVNWLMVDPDEGNLMTELRNIGGRTNQPSLLSRAPIADGNWHRVGFIWDGTSRILYVDDVEVAKDTQPGLGSSTGGLYLGAGKNLEPGSFFSGLIDEVRIYDRAITP